MLPKMARNGLYTTPNAIKRQKSAENGFYNTKRITESALTLPKKGLYTTQNDLFGPNETFSAFSLFQKVKIPKIPKIPKMPKMDFQNIQKL